MDKNVKTASWHGGNKFSERHNFNKEFRSRQEHINPELSDRNIELIHIPLYKAYDALFLKSLTEYNKKQVDKGHPERQINNYLNHLQNDKNRHSHNIGYEIIIQVGDKNTTGNTNDAKEVEILKDYVKEFQERNPNMFVFGAVIHRDEATTHLHLDYIPVGHGFKRGLEIQNSLNRALYEQGFQTDKKIGTAQKQWTARERSEFERLCREHGIEVEHKNENREHLEKQNFILHAKNKELDEELSLKREVVLELDKELEMKRNNLDKIHDELKQLAERRIEPIEPQKKIGGTFVRYEDYIDVTRQYEALITKEKDVTREYRDRALNYADKSEKLEKERDLEYKKRIELQDKLRDKDFLREQLREIEDRPHQRDIEKNR